MDVGYLQLPNASGFAELSFRKEDDVVALEVRGVGKRFANDTNSQFAPAYQIMGIRWQRSNLIRAKSDDTFI
jgi:hypothetical protein